MEWYGVEGRVEIDALDDEQIEEIVREILEQFVNTNLEDNLESARDATQEGVDKAWSDAVDNDDLAEGTADR